MTRCTVRSLGSKVAARAALVAALVLVCVPAAHAGSTPVGPLPAGPVSTVKTERGNLVAVALPRQKASTGLVWRLARNINPKIVRPIDEIDTPSSVVIVFKVTGPGTASIVFALTRGESSPKALRSHTTKIKAS
jgi:hypothetical protein